MCGPGVAWQFLRPLEVWAYEYRIYPGGPESDTPTEARRIPRYLVHRHHTYLSSEDPHFWRRYLNDRALADLFLTPWEGDAWTSYAPRVCAEVPAQRYQELYQRFCFAQTYIASLYPELHERELEIGRLRRHQSRQASAISHLQMEVDRLQIRLEVEGIPLDFSEEEADDDDGSSSDNAPPPPPSSVRQAAAGPSRRRR
ncbi:hypothetical protein JCGZ_19498 [Jatropha curcas]|uniref:Aminotransferase-like plant mobile domain-containing protein n=1 Tax=Jatropha curcas TaxID=180498 RepID=A0A067LBV0_JATCU|nr:hypothetical protein JCGZ_19498 [Jatropha curcas]